MKAPESSGSSRGKPMLSDPQMRAWWTYRRRPEFEAVVTPVRVPMSDGAELDCDLIRPSRDGAPLDGPFPGMVVELTPYAVVRDMWNQEATWFTTRGYVTVVGSVRGTGESGGTWQHAMSSQDGRDAAQVVEWLASQPFCDGRIGQLGESYGGQTTYGAAVERPPHLRAIAPMQSPANLYDDVIYPGGIKTTERGTIDNWPPTAKLLSGERIDADAEYSTNRAHPTFDDYWQDRALLGRIGEVIVPVLAIGGWQDEFFRAGALHLIEEGLDRTWAFYGPWPHFPPQSYDDPPADGQLPGGVLLAWFDRWLRDDTEAPIPDEPVFCSFEGPEASGRGWQMLDEWVPGGRDVATWELGAGGTLGPEAEQGVLVLRQPAEPDGRDTACTFGSGVLERDRTLIGWPIVTFDAALSAPDAHFYVELLDVTPDGSEVPVSSGFLKASHRGSHVIPESVPVGRRQAYTIKIRASHWRFAAGHRVRIRLSGGPSDLLTPVPEPVIVELFAGDGATVALPGFGDAY